VVDLAIVDRPQTADPTSYTGTTQPVRVVSAKTRTEGQVLELTADVGDEVVAGQRLATIDSQLLQTELDQAIAELEARRSEVEQAEFNRADAQTRIAQAEAELDQARADANRYKNLAAEGVVPDQRAEVAITALNTAQQAVFSAQEQMAARERVIETAQQRVTGQQAIVERVQERLSYAEVISPLDGIVLERVVEEGDVVQTGNTIITIGDFSQVQVRIDVPDQELAQVNTGQSVEVTLDALPQQTFSGRISRIFPIADAVARLIPVEITLTNPRSNRGNIGGGLLARVKLTAGRAQTGVMIAASALEQSADGGQAVVFVVQGNDRTPQVQARSVVVGDRFQDQVEIKAGLVPGDQYVMRSDRPLEAGQRVRRSFLSPRRSAS